MIKAKRVYEEVAKRDGERVLVDRLWPRGLKKSEAQIDLWAKEIAPSNDLRKWFHANPEMRFLEFKKKYRKELSGKRAEAKSILALGKNITLVTAAKDIEHSHIPVVQSYLNSALKRK